MIEIGYSALGISLPLFVAERRGLFADHGLAVKLVSYPTAHPLVEAVVHAGGPACGGFVAFPIAFHRHLAGKRLRYAGAVLEDRHNPISFLLVREGAGISSIEELGGRKVGVLPTKAYREWFKLLAAKHGLGYHQIKLEATCRCMETGEACSTGLPTMKVYDVDPDQTVAMLASGELDAIFTNDPGATAAVAAGVAQVWGDEPLLPALLSDPHYFGSFIFDDAFAREQPAVVTRIVQAIDAAIRLVRAQPDMARRCASDYLPAGCADLSTALGRPRFMTSEEVDGARLQEMADQLEHHRIVRGRVEVTPSLLRAAALESRRAAAALT